MCNVRTGQDEAAAVALDKAERNRKMNCSFRCVGQ
jgi:hypothetical protein